MMLTLELSKKQSKPIMKLLEADIINLLVSLKSRGGPKTLYKITPIAFLRN